MRGWCVVGCEGGECEGGVVGECKEGPRKKSCGIKRKNPIYKDNYGRLHMIGRERANRALVVTANENSTQ